ncbi:MAG: tetratricopeptide repeat protein [Acidobacteriota bacterium]|nr:tetratricopeptide repeat protein [Acidobacteriota bacterium]
MTNLLEFDGGNLNPRLEQDARKRMLRLRAELDKVETRLERMKLYLELAQACFDAREPAEAEEYWSEALGLCDRVGDRHIAVHCLSNLGLVSLATAKNDEAAKRLFRALSIYDELNERPGLADTHHRLGAVYYTLGKWDESIHHFEASCRFGNELNDRLRQALAYDSLAPLYRAQGNESAAENALRHAINYYTALGDPRDRARCMCLLAEVVEARGDHETAAATAEESLALLEKEGDSLGWALQAARLVTFYLDTNRRVTGRDLVNKARTILDERGYFGEMGYVFRALGDIETRAGHLTGALKFYTGARRRFLQLGDQRGIATVEEKIGRLEEGQNQIDWAREHYTSALPRFRKLGDLPRMSAILRGLGRLALKNNRPSQATEYYQQAFDLDRKVGNPGMLALGADYLAEINSARNKHERALEMAELALEWARQTDSEAEANALARLGEVRQRAGFPDEARRYYSEAQEAYKKLGSPGQDKMRSALQGLAR